MASLRHAVASLCARYCITAYRRLAICTQAAASLRASHCITARMLWRVQTTASLRQSSCQHERTRLRHWMQHCTHTAASLRTHGCVTAPKQLLHCSQAAASARRLPIPARMACDCVTTRKQAHIAQHCAQTAATMNASCCVNECNLLRHCVHTSRFDVARTSLNEFHRCRHVMVACVSFSKVTSSMRAQPSCCAHIVFLARIYSPHARLPDAHVFAAHVGIVARIPSLRRRRCARIGHHCPIEIIARTS